MTNQTNIFPCGCDDGRVKAGLCDVHDANGVTRVARAQSPFCRQHVMALARKFDDRANSARDLVDAADDSHTHVEQDAIARTWQAAARMIRLLADGQLQAQNGVDHG